MWLSSNIFYERVKIKKKTWFGYRRKLGYRLTKPLRYKYKEGVFFVLETGYLWDGPSYLSWIEWLVGKRNHDGSLAASAMHDVHNRIPTRYVTKDAQGQKEIAYTKYNILDGAELYRKMLNEWPDRKETVSETQSKMQKIGLVLFQPFYSLVNQHNEWEIDN
jgi:hypothetical protein